MRRFWIFEDRWARVIIWLLQSAHCRENRSSSHQPAVGKGRSSKQFSSSQCQTEDQSACLLFSVCAMFLRLFIYFHCGAAEIEKLLCQQPSVCYCRNWGSLLLPVVSASLTHAWLGTGNAPWVYFTHDWCKIHTRCAEHPRERRFPPAICQSISCL